MKNAGLAVVVCLAAIWMAWPRTAYPHNPTTTTVLFNREVATLLQRKCVQCHAAGKMAMPLVTYADTRPWAQAIKEETLARRMPPWPAERGYGNFSNDLGLTPREFEFLISWIDGGVPIGTGDAPAYVDHGTHWMLGEPNIVASPGAPVTIDAKSAPAFRRLIVDTGVEREAWVRGFDFKPDPRVTRAAFLSIAGSDRYLGGWTPWQSSTELPKDTGIRLPAKARIAVDVLYSGATDAVTDTPRLGLYFAASAPSAVVDTSLLRPRASSGRMVAEVKFPDARALVSLRPQMDGGGRSLELKLRRPDGSTEVLLWIKQFRPDWQTPYVFQKPIAVPAGATLEAIGYGAPFTIAVNHYADQ